MIVRATEIELRIAQVDNMFIRREKIRELYNTHLGGLLSSPIEEVDGGLATDRVIVAYSRPPNLRDLLQSAKLQHIEGEEVSTYFGS